MSLGQISRTGAKTPIAGLNGLSGELVPSVSYYQKGTVTSPALTNGTATAGAYASVTVTLPEAMPDNDYVVALSRSSQYWADTDVQVRQDNKTTTQFTLLFSSTTTVAIAAGTFTVQWQAFKLMTDESRALDEQAIADIQAVIPSSASASNLLATKNDITTVTQWIAASNAVTYRKADIKLPGVSGVVQLITKSGDVYFISKRDGSSIKFTKVVNGVGGDVVTISGYSFDTTESVLTLYFTMAAWSSVRIDVLNAWSKTQQAAATITVSVIEQSEIGGTAPTIVNVVTDTDFNALTARVKALEDKLT